MLETIFEGLVMTIIIIDVQYTKHRIWMLAVGAGLFLSFNVYGSVTQPVHYKGRNLKNIFT